jgi:hypothetical protein
VDLRGHRPGSGPADPTGIEWSFDPWTWLVPVAMLAAATLAWPLAMLALSESMRMAKVRYAHILRATGYSLAWVAGLMVVRAGLLVAWGFGGWRADAWVPLWVLAVLGWLAIWWFNALTLGFKLGRGGLIWALLMVISVLSTMAAGLYLHQWLHPNGI